ncbi:uncharacterized protein METZ01_LOCUS217771 [marine metagenome]|uniref:Uncharacterized protein n=1 Tax=marine metagenome TaxID=408172 RepID=A0A382FRZ8_9ZZZZ
MKFFLYLDHLKNAFGKVAPSQVFSHRYEVALVGTSGREMTP